MKKEIGAILALAILFSCSIYNIHYMDNLAETMLIHVDTSRKRAESGDFGQAEAELRQAIDLWSASQGYTHIFIRHPEIDSATDAFYELLSDIISQDFEAAQGSYEKAAAHIRSIAAMEHLTLGSIL